MIRSYPAGWQRPAAGRLVCAILLAACAAVSVRAETLPKRQLSAGVHLIHAEIAANDAARSRGLMFRETLAPSSGMLFVFQRADTQCFWMRNTLIPLTIAFLDDDGKVVNLADMAPRTETAHCSAQPVRYALEMNQGWFADRGIGPGSRIDGLRD